MRRIIEPSREQLEQRRRDVLEQVGADYDELARRAARHDLEGDEWWAWEELRSIEFLLDGEQRSSSDSE